MVRNNIELDVKTKCIEQGKTQVQIAEDIDTTKAYVNPIIKRTDGVVNKTFVQMILTTGAVDTLLSVYKKIMVDLFFH